MDILEQALTTFAPPTVVTDAFMVTLVSTGNNFIPFNQVSHILQERTRFDQARRAAPILLNPTAHTSASSQSSHGSSLVLGGIMAVQPTGVVNVRPANKNESSESSPIPGRYLFLFYKSTTRLL